MNLLLGEIKKITRRKQFLFMTAILFGAVFTDFFITCAHYYEKPLSLVPSAYHSIIIYNFFGTPASTVFESFLFPLAAGIIASDLYFEEKMMGINNMIVTRVSKKSYIWHKLWSIVIIVFAITVLPILLNILLALIAFPVQGYFTTKSPIKLLMEPDKLRIFNFLKNWYPYWNVIVFSCIRGVFAVMSALLAFSVSFVKNANRYFILLSPMLFFIVYTLIASFISDIPALGERTTEMIVIHILAVNPYGSIWTFLLYFFLEIGISVILIRKGMSSDDLC